MVINKRYISTIALILGGLSTVVALIGNGCSGGFQSVGSSTALSLGQCKEPMEIKSVPGEQAESIVYGDQVLDNMVSCTGLQQASARTQAEFAARRASFSEYGYAGDVTAPMMMGVAAVAVEVCNDLINQEKNLSNIERRIFNAINFQSTSVGSSDVSETVRRLARACWGREETTEELAHITEGIQDILSSGTARGPASDGVTFESRFAAISICTSVLASLDGIRM